MPPNTGPKAAPAEMAAPFVPSTLPNVDGATSRRRYAIALGMMNAAPMPWSDRNTTSEVKFHEAAAASEKIISATRPADTTRRWPMASPSLPPTGWLTATAIR